jgi:hypothetical protein
MKSSLNILHLEDDPNDATVIQSTLDAEGISCAINRVHNRKDFVAALEHGGVDLILSDYRLPIFDGMSALKIAHAEWPEIPFIFISGTLGEERAIDSLKGGATDYVLKDRLARLASAVRRAMREVEQCAEKRRTQEALHETEGRLRIIFNESPLGIGLVGRDGRPVLTNPALQKMLGYTDAELCRMHFADFTHSDDRARDTQLYQELIQGARSSYFMEKRFIRKDGQIIWAHLSVSLSHATAGPTSFAIGMVEDITERRNLEAQIIEAQKMEVIGQLAGGVAHDFNNILAVIMGYCDLMAQKLPPEDEFTSYVETVRSSAQRAAGLTRQLLIFSRKQQVQPVVLDLNEVVKDMDKILRRLIDENIEMTIVPAQRLGSIKADSGYVGQVLMNLVVNARDAMLQGGRLIITTSNVTLDDNYARENKGAIPGVYVMLSVSDTGTGMADEVKAHMFEAFFTTKPKGKGTGLGLATCHTIVQQSGGYIEVCSEVGKGSTFKIYFPQVDEPPDLAARPPTGLAPRGTETVLVVEDEPTLRHLARSVLEIQGYNVISASNGQEALHAVRGHKGAPISLVITDVIMPLMGGKVMAEWLRTANPDLKILFTSGYTEDSISQLGSPAEAVDFLPKPYTPSLLARKVRDMLDEKNASSPAAGETK